MKSRKATYRLSAFSVLEVTVVIALMALLSGLFFAALNRFNEQVRVEGAIKNELNNWFAIRSNLWRELDEADSMSIRPNSVTLFSGARSVRYFVQEDALWRNTGSDDANLNIPMLAIRQQQADRRECVEFLFDWKNGEMSLRYPLRSDLSAQVNNYFSSKKWQ